IVSHDRYFLDKTVTEIWEIEDTHLDSYKGNYSKFSVLKKEKIKVLEKEYEIQERKIASLEDYVARNLVRASTTKMAQSRRTQLEKMDRIEKPKTSKKHPYIRFPFDRQPVKDVFHSENINLFYEDNGEKNYISKNINIDALKGEKVAIIGDNGIGKSTLLKAILKYIPCEYDKLVWGANTKISYYDQEGKQLHSSKQVINELWDRFPKMYEQEVRTHLGSMLFTGEEVYKQVSSLSGGEKARLALSILSLEKPNVLVMDEPTNHIDIETKEALEEALLDYEGTIILVSHDRYLLNKLPTKIYEVTKNGSTLYNGNFDFYLKNKVTPIEEKVVEEKKPSENAIKHYRSKQDRARLVSSKKRADLIEKTIAGNEEKISQLEAMMTTQEVTSDYQKLNEICGEITSLKGQNDELSDEWILLCEEIEMLSAN
ncbi:MAG: ABC-F family ATP-binding cassette domain-containing protein, partial [Oscillospiraceae bacterium]